MKHSKEYSAIHHWLKKMYGAATMCEGTDCRLNSKNYNWCLIEGKKYEYKRENYVQMCVSCHRRYDMTDLTIRKISRPVSSYTAEGVKVRSYTSMAEAGRERGRTYKAILHAITDSKKKSGGLYWRYDEPLPETRINHNQKVVAIIEPDSTK